jgi:CheY-like chemotaxis protein
MSERRILIVDDEPAVLNGIERKLGDRFPITTCSSPVEALEILRQTRDFAVVLTDMRMPALDGLQFIEKARAITPNSIYMMFTGDQDLRTLIRAVNGNHIYRYLTKPCSTEAIAVAFEAALAKHQEAEAEDQLLKATFSGAVDVMSDLMGTTHPILSSVSERVKYVLPFASEQLGWQKDWELEIAARLCLAGFSVIPELKITELIDSSSAFNDANRATIVTGLKNTRQMMSRMPRLETVCGIVSQMVGDATEFQPDQPRRGELLGLLFVYALASRKPEFDKGILKSTFPNASDDMISTVISANEKLMSAKKHAEKVSIKHLMSGMILASDLVAAQKPVLRTGDVITDRIRDHLLTISSLPQSLDAFVLG